MPRPGNKFALEHTVRRGKDWQCKYCDKLFTGSSTRIVYHLSREGHGISPCKKVPDQIREEALKNNEVCKRKQHSSMGEDNAGVKRNKKEAEDSVYGALLKLEIATNSEFINHPDFMALLKTLDQHGVPSIILQQGNHFSVERAIVDIREEVFKYMSTVLDSWFTTGCTVMVFNLKVGEYVYGFYSSKGLLFVEAGALLSHMPSLNFKRVTHIMDHHYHHGFFLDYCKFSGEDKSESAKKIQIGHLGHTTKVSCLRRKIKGGCIESCKKSFWAWSLIEKAGEIHKLIAECYLYDWYHTRLETKQEFKEFTNIGELEDPLSRFISIILLEDDLKESLPDSLGYGVSLPRTQLKTLIYNNSVFWDEGKELKRALAPILKIPYFLDTLVPTVGYLDSALDKAKQAVFWDDQRPRKEDPLWESLREFLDDTGMYAMRQPIAAYLNPFYFRNGHAYNNVDLKGIARERLLPLVEERDLVEMDKQLQCYNNESTNPFRKFDLMFETCHPVELWEKHGQGLPLLKKYAIQILSQPASCMCNQVKKHMLQREGANDYILRLNVSMMQEFRNMGANIYKPIDLEGICRR